MVMIWIVILVTDTYISYVFDLIIIVLYMREALNKYNINPSEKTGFPEGCFFLIGNV